MVQEDLNEHDFHPSAAQDVSPKANRRIWMYFILMGISLFLIIWGLIIMFRFILVEEQEKKIGMVLTKERTDYISNMNAIVSGNKGIFSDKKNVSVDDAMKIFLQKFRENSSR